MMLRNWLKCFNWLTPSRQPQQQLGKATFTRPARAKIGRHFEQLEQREVPSAATWIGGATGFWDVAANWSGNAVPNAAADVSISTTTPATITLRSGDVASINSLTIGANDTLSITGGSLTSTANSTVNGALTLSGGTLKFNSGLTDSGTITINAANTMTVIGAYTQTAAGTLSMPGGGLPGLPASNLLATPGFESPVATTNGVTTASGWTTWGSAYLNNHYAETGTQSVASSGASSQAIQSFAATPGASYTFSVDAMVASPLTGSEAGYMHLFFYDSSGNQLSGYGAPNAITVLTSSNGIGGPIAGSVGGLGWNHFTTTAVAPSNAATVQADLVTGAFNGSGSGSGTIYWDNASFGPASPGPSKLVAGSASNSGSITVGPTNTISTNGAFTQTATGTLDLQLAGAPNYYGAVQAGTAALGGTLKTDLMYGYVPSTTDTFTPITFASASGAFASAQLPSGGGYQLQEATTFTNVVVSAVPTTALTATVNASNVLHAASANLLGLNLVNWDTSMATAQSQQLVQAAGLTTYRFPGGGNSDNFHFNGPGTGGNTIPQFVQFIQAVGGTGLVSLDYGSGSPQESAAELAYLQGSTTDTTQIGAGLVWSNSANQWQSVNFGTVGYWASLRAATPLATNDGLNFLRINHAAPFTNIKYWEVGNEEYGGWELDHHGTSGPGGVSTGSQHDPATYAAFASQFATLAKEITTTAGIPMISIGIDSQDPTGISDSSWTQNVLTSGFSRGFVPGFISDHSYAQPPGAENDSVLLNGTVTNAPNILDWSTRSADYQSLLQATVGSQAANVQLMATEFNSVGYNPGKQSTSLVNGLFIAESLGSLLNSGYTNGYIWDMRNGFDTSQNNSQALYGWQIGGDYGIVGSGQSQSGADMPYPSYFAEQLASKLVQSGGQVVSVNTNYQGLDVFGVLEANGHLDLMVINTNAAASENVQFNLAGFQPSGQATFWQYGKAQDLAQSQSSTGAAALANFNATLSLNGSGFAYAFPSYSMTVIDLTPASGSTPPPVQVPTVQGPATATIGHTQTLAFSGARAFSISDPAATASTVDSLAVRVVGGTVNVNLSGGATITTGANGSASLTLSGTLTQLNSALAAMTYTAPATGASDTLTVTATDGSAASTPISTAIALTNVAPTVATPATAAPSTVMGVSTSLSVLGADAEGQSNLVYTWSTTGTSPAAVQFSINGTNAAKNATATFTKAGTYSFQVTITDAGGLTATSSASVTVNQTLSTIAVTPAAATIAPNSTDAISAKALDQFGQVMATQPTLAWSASGGSISSGGIFTPPTGSGVYTVSAASGSISGNATVTVNNVPVATIGAPSTSLTAGGPITYAVTVNDATFNAASLTAASFTLNATGTATATLALTGTGNNRTLTLGGVNGNGTLGVTLRANSIADLNGSTNVAAVASSTFMVDNASPTTAITAQPGLYSNSTTAAFSFTGADPSVNGVSTGINQLQYNLDGGAFAATTSSVSLTGLTDGVHTFQVRAVDNVGNVGTATSYIWTVDTTLPSLLIGAPSASMTAGSPVGYSVTVTDPNFNPASLTAASFTLNTTGTATAAPTLTGSGANRILTLNGISGNGTLGVTLAANSMANMAGTTNAAAIVSSNVIVDTTAPTIAITVDPPLYSNSATADFSFNAADPSVNGISTGVNQLQYQLDGGAFTTTSSHLSLAGLAAGAHAIQVRAIDNVGNVGTAGSYNWTVDTTLPTVVIGTPSSSSTTSGPVSYSVTVTDANFNAASLIAADFTVNATGTATGNLALTGTGNSRTLTISGISGNGTLGVTLAAHSIADLAGNTNTAAVVSPTFNVSLSTVAVTSVVVNGGTVPIISATESGTTVTVTTDGPSGLSAGQSVLIAGVGAGYNGAHTITKVNSNNTFTYTAGVTGLAKALGGTATPAQTSRGPLDGVQRSMVDSIVYTFSQPVNLGANAFTLVVHSGGNAGGSVPTLSYGSPDGGLTWVVTFSGNGVVGNSIANGAYDITLNKAAVSAVAGGGLASSRTDTFFRLFGDSNGNLSVGSWDQNVFNAAIWSNSLEATFQAMFDSHDNGKNSSVDYTAFNADYGVAFTGFTPTI